MLYYILENIIFIYYSLTLYYSRKKKELVGTTKKCALRKNANVIFFVYYIKKDTENKVP